MKPDIPVTLIAVDTTAKSHLASRAIDKSIEQITPRQITLIGPGAAKLEGLKAYSEFCIRDMAKYVDTSHALVIQADGYVVNGNAWTDEFLKYDYAGAAFNPSGIVGNGGFSLRSKRLLDYLARSGWDDCHPEDSAICVRHRDELHRAGFRFAPKELAGRFAIEGRAWNSKEWQGVPNAWNGQFGFHSWLTPRVPTAPNVFHHSGDAGDVVYSMPVIKALGGGVLFLSGDNQHPWPLPSRWQRMGAEAEWVDNLRPLLEAQDYIWSAKYTHGTPFSTTHDLNRFRIPWKERTARDFDSILKLHCDAFNVAIPTIPWLAVADPITVPGRPIVIARSQRYHGNLPWDRFLAKNHAKCVFVGTDLEAGLIQGMCVPHKIPHYKTADALQLARVIAGAKICVMNQSLPLAIAHGLHKTVVVDEWAENANCRVPNPNAHYAAPGNWL